MGVAADKACDTFCIWANEQKMKLMIDKRVSRPNWNTCTQNRDFVVEKNTASERYVLVVSRLQWSKWANDPLEELVNPGMNAVHIRTSSRYWPGTCLVTAGSPRTKVWLNITIFTIRALCVTNESWGSFCMHWGTSASWALSRTSSAGNMLIKIWQYFYQMIEKNLFVS